MALHSFFKRNGLLLVFIALMVVSLRPSRHSWRQNGEVRSEKSLAQLSVTAYLHSAHFIEATFENWGSEFLQMVVYVAYTILYPHGSTESRSFDELEKLDRKQRKHNNAFWPVKRGAYGSAFIKTA